MGWRCYQTGWAYLCLGLNDDIFTQNGLLLPAPRPAPRPLPQLPAWIHLPTRSNQRSRTFLTNSCTHPFYLPFHFVLAPLPPRLSHLHIQARVRCTLSTSDDGFALPSSRFGPCRVAIKPLVIAKHNGFLHQLSRLMKTSAPSSRPSCNDLRI